ncbi:MAG TPA: hypothetical protein VMW16_03650 [Sedimentisphaerales bacterium]|nr:hypothetical protein [Sedimentisphaerales bacterium]
MAKDINIHLKTTGAEQTKEQLDQTARSAEKIGESTQQAGRQAVKGAEWVKSAFSAIVGPLGLAALAAAVINIVRKIRAAINDMKQASSEAVSSLAALQKASADYFEAFEAYSPEQRQAALLQARQFQAKTGLPIEASQKLLEAYKRTFGKLNEAAVEQLAGYWQLHGQEATLDLVRWMGAERVTTPQRQGQITRMVSAVASETGLRDAEIISALTRYSTELRGLGWTPEETIMNIGKALAGKSPLEARRAMSSLVDGIRAFTEEKALEMKAAAEIAASEKERLAWARQTMLKMEPEARRKFARQAFGETAAPYVTGWLLAEYPEKTRRALEYARTPDAAEQERQRVEAVKQTAEAGREITEGGAKKLELLLAEEEKQRDAIREYGRVYLEYLRRRDRIQYELIKARAGDNVELQKEEAAKVLFELSRPPPARTRKELASLEYRQTRVEPPEKIEWQDIPLEEKTEELKKAINKIYDREVEKERQRREQRQKQKKEPVLDQTAEEEPSPPTAAAETRGPKRITKEQPPAGELAGPELPTETAPTPARRVAAEIPELPTETAPAPARRVAAEIPEPELPTETAPALARQVAEIPVLEAPTHVVHVTHNYNNNLQFFPSVHEDDRGPRFEQV